MGDYDDPELTGQGPPQRGRWLAVGAVVAALILGLAAGFVAGGGTSRDSSVATVETSPAPTPEPSPEPTPPAAVEACAESAAAGAAVLAELNRGVQAIGALDFGTVREVLDRIQPLQRELEGAVAACGLPVAAPR
ncbi:MAG: hypothetical protein L0H64_10375 [Pseudonocardia sp.]|nr:hypothetical protein [Pseudonocardia sp.]